MVSLNLIATRHISNTAHLLLSVMIMAAQATITAGQITLITATVITTITVMPAASGITGIAVTQHATITPMGQEITAMQVAETVQHQAETITTEILKSGFKQQSYLLKASEKSGAFLFNTLSTLFPQLLLIFTQ